MENDKALELVKGLHREAAQNFTRAREDAESELRQLIANAQRELAHFEAGHNVSIDWVEDQAKRYHEALVKCESFGRMLSVTEYAVREISEVKA